MKNQKSKICLVLAVLVFLSGCVAKETKQPISTEVTSDAKYVEMRVGDVVLSKVEVADTPAKITKGLGYRDEIGGPSARSGSVNGMLFIQNHKTVPSFWMKGMRFGLDMVWIDCSQATSDKEQGTSFVENNEAQILNHKPQTCTVVDVDEKIPAPDDPEDWRNLPTYSPKVEVTHVLEVEYGWWEEKGLEVGVEVDL